MQEGLRITVDFKSSQESIIHITHDIHDIHDGRSQGLFLTLEEVFEQLIKTPQEAFDTLNQTCYETLDSISVEASVNDENDIPVPLSAEKPRFIVVDAVQRSDRNLQTIVQEMQLIADHYPKCVVLYVSSVPADVNLLEKNAVLQHIQNAWAELLKRKKPSEKRSAAWLQAVKTPSSWLSVSNFVLIAAGALSIGAFLAWLNPEILAAAAPALVGTGMVALAVGAVVFPFFAAWKMYEHYNAWRFEAWGVAVKYRGNQEYNYYRSNSNISYSKYVSYDAQGWKNFNEYVEGQSQKNPDLKKVGYGYYLLALGSQLWTWSKAHKAQATLVAVGLIISAALIGFGVGFFLGDALSMALLNPMLELVNNVLSTGLTGLSQTPGLEFLSAIFTSYIGNIVGVTLTAALPLIIMDGIRRLADTIWKGQQAGGEPLLMVEDNYKAGYDATIPEHNEDLGARAAADKFWTEVGKEIEVKYEAWKGPKYETVS